MSKHTEPAEQDAESNDAQLKNRRDFLKSLGKWSTIIIGGIALGGIHGAGRRRRVAQRWWRRSLGQRTRWRWWRLG